MSIATFSVGPNTSGSYTLPVNVTTCILGTMWGGNRYFSNAPMEVPTNVQAPLYTIDYLPPNYVSVIEALRFIRNNRTVSVTNLLEFTVNIYLMYA